MITASTALTIIIMNIHLCGAEAKPVPHWAKVIILDYMSKIFFVYDVGENCTTSQDESDSLSQDSVHSYDGFEKEPEFYSALKRPLSIRTDFVCDIDIHAKLSGHPDENKADHAFCNHCIHHRALASNIEYITDWYREQKSISAKGIEWKKVAKVMDRFFMWVFFIMVFFMSILIIAKAV